MSYPARRARLLCDLEQDFLPDYDAVNLPSGEKGAAYTLEHRAKPGRDCPGHRNSAAQSVGMRRTPSAAIFAVKPMVRADPRALLHSRYFPEHAPERLIRLFGEIGIKGAKFGRLGDEAFI